MARIPPRARNFIGPHGMEVWELTHGAAVAEVVPARGGLVTRFAVDGDEVLYLEPETVADRQKNVRGGIPVLFPIAGRLEGDRYQSGSASYPMRQHGLARHAAWSVSEVGGARLTMELRSTQATRINFPFDFCLRMTVDLGRAGGRTLALELEVQNLGPGAMPLHLGLHPYFFVPDQDKGRLRLEVPARAAYDNVQGRPVPYDGRVVELGRAEVDLHLSGLATDQVGLPVPGRAPRLLSFSDLFPVLVLWAVQFKDFVCVEPWSAPGNALNTGQGLIHLGPGEMRQGWFVIST